MKYLNKTFSVGLSSKNFDKNYDKVFRKPLVERLDEKSRKVLDNIESIIWKNEVKV